MSAHRGWLLGPLAALLALLALAQPAVSAARPGWEERPRSLRLALQAPASHGYKMSVKTSGHRQVTLSLSKGAVVAEYKTTGRVSRNRIEADFGELGELSVKFRGRPARPEPLGGLGLFLPPGFFGHDECRGRKPQLESGNFHGTIRFAGEHGFAEVETDSAKGSMQRAYRRLCRHVPRRRGQAASRAAGASSLPAGKRKPPKPYLDLLVAGGNQDGRRVLFEAFSFGGGSGFLAALLEALGSLALVKTVEHRDGIKIKRTALVSGEQGSLIVSPPKHKRVDVTVAFPKPFEGTAEFERSPGAPPSWIGSLVARLPGAGAVALTGEGLVTRFCHIPITAKDSACAEKTEEAFPDARRARPLLLQESGSHSHALADVKLSWSR